MARYKVKSKSFIDDRIVEAGTEIEFDGEPGENLEPVDDAAKAAVEAAAERRAAKAEAIKSAVAGTLDPQTADTVQQLIASVQGFAGRLAAVEARTANVEAAATPDLSAYATKADVEAVRADVGELDTGLTMVSGRVSEVEGTLTALANKPAPATPPAPPAEPVAEQPVAPDAPPADPAA